MAQPQINKLTVEDYWQMPDDGRRYEILEGMLEATPSPVYEHQTVIRNLLVLLDTFLRRTGAGEVIQSPMDVILSNETVCQPDLLFIRKERVDQIVRDRVWGAPDLVIEVLSPGTAARDLQTKRHIYARHRIPEYWIVDPKNRTLQRFVLLEVAYGSPETLLPGQTLETPLIPGLELAVGEIFS